MRTHAKTGLVLAALTLLAPVRAHAADTLEIDAAKSELVARLFKGGVAAAMGHDHVIRAASVSGKVQLDPRKPELAKVEIVVPAAKLIADEPAVRTKYRVEKQLDAEDRAKVQKTMLSAEQLDVARYPEIKFVSKRIAKTGAGDKYTITGDFTLHGQTKELTTQVEAKIGKGDLRARGAFRIKQSDFGIEPFSAGLGTVRNKDELEIDFSIVATSRGSDAAGS